MPHNPIFSIDDFANFCHSNALHFQIIPYKKWQQHSSDYSLILYIHNMYISSQNQWIVRLLLLSISRRMLTCKIIQFWVYNYVVLEAIMWTIFKQEMKLIDHFIKGTPNIIYWKTNILIKICSWLHFYNNYWICIFCTFFEWKLSWL